MFVTSSSSLNPKNLSYAKFIFRTSQDGTWANNGMMGFHRYSCLNGLVIGNKLAYVYGRHTKNFDPISFGAKFKTASEYIASGETINKMRKWYKTKIKRSDISNLFCNS